MIPLNATFDEIINYHLSDLSIETRNRIDDAHQKDIKDFEIDIAELEEAVEELEVLEESDGFKEELLITIWDLIDNKGTIKELVKSIKLAFEESQVEL